MTEHVAEQTSSTASIVWHLVDDPASGGKWIPHHDQYYNSMSVDVLMYGYVDLSQTRHEQYHVCYYSFTTQAWYINGAGATLLDFVPLCWRYLGDPPMPLPEKSQNTPLDATGSTESDETQ